MSIEVQHIRKTYGTFEALQDVSMRIEKGELVALLGPSGSGKTTLLRIIAGLDLPDSGTVRLNDEDATNSTARDRQVGFVFQHYALFRHLRFSRMSRSGCVCGPNPLVLLRTRSA